MGEICSRCNKVKGEVVRILSGKAICYFCIDDMIMDEEMKDFDEHIEFLESENDEY